MVDSKRMRGREVKRHMGYLIWQGSSNYFEQLKV